MAGRKLVTTVHVEDEAGNYHVFGPGDNVPAALAARITNAAVWEPEPEPDLDGEPSEDWTVADIKAYAELHDIDLGDATKKADILAAVRAAGNDQP